MSMLATEHILLFYSTNLATGKWENTFPQLLCVNLFLLGQAYFIPFTNFSTFYGAKHFTSLCKSMLNNIFFQAILKKKNPPMAGWNKNTMKCKHTLDKARKNAWFPDIDKSFHKVNLISANTHCQIFLLHKSIYSECPYTKFIVYILHTFWMKLFFLVKTKNDIVINVTSVSATVDGLVKTETSRTSRKAKLTSSANSFSSSSAVIATESSSPTSSNTY